MPENESCEIASCGRKWLGRAVVTTGIVVPLLLIASCVNSFLEDPFPAHSTGCSEVVQFAGATMPEEATDKKCVDGGGWSDRGYTVDFRMPRTPDLTARILEAFPRTALHGEEAGKLHFGIDFDREKTKPEGLSTYLYVDVTVEGGDTALVHVQAFNT